MGLSFRSLTLDAGVCPLLDVSVEPRLYKLGGKETLGGSYSWMGKAMEG